LTFNPRRSYQSSWTNQLAHRGQPHALHGYAAGIRSLTSSGLLQSKLKGTSASLASFA
jgi:hypothetical protein